MSEDERHFKVGDRVEYFDGVGGAEEFYGDTGTVMKVVGEPPTLLFVQFDNGSGFGFDIRNFRHFDEPETILKSELADWIDENLDDGELDVDALRDHFGLWNIKKLEITIVAPWMYSYTNFTDERLLEELTGLPGITITRKVLN